MDGLSTKGPALGRPKGMWEMDEKRSRGQFLVQITSLSLELESRAI